MIIYKLIVIALLLVILQKQGLIYINCNYLQFRNQDNTVGSSTSLQIFHQNIRGLRSKNDELINSLETDNINPHVLCFSKYHMEEQDVLHLSLSGYVLGFCRQNLQNGGVCIFVQDLYFSKINISRSCEEKDLKICATELRT